MGGRGRLGGPAGRRDRASDRRRELADLHYDGSVMVLRQALAACSRNLCTSVPIAAERVGSTLAAQEMSRAEGACACDNPGGGPRVQEGRRESVPQEYSVLSEFSPIHARTRSPLTVKEQNAIRSLPSVFIRNIIVERGNTRHALQ